MALLIRFQHALDQAGEEGDKGRRSSRSRKRSTLYLGSGDGKQQDVCTDEGTGRLEADKAKVGAGILAEEADIAELGECFSDIQLLKEGEASDLENEVSFRAHFIAGFVHLLS